MFFSPFFPVCLLASSLYLSLIYLRLHIHSLPTVKCDETLASPLPHTAFTSSSVFSNGYAPGYAKLNRRGGTPALPNRTSHVPSTNISMNAPKGSALTPTVDEDMQ